MVIIGGHALVKGQVFRRKKGRFIKDFKNIKDFHALGWGRGPQNIAGYRAMSQRRQHPEADLNLWAQGFGNPIGEGGEKWSIYGNGNEGWIWVHGISVKGLAVCGSMAEKRSFFGRKGWVWG
jgi:hypothetical protein